MGKQMVARKRAVRKSSSRNPSAPKPRSSRLLQSAKEWLSGGTGVYQRMGAMRRRCHLSQEDIGRLTGYSTRSVAGWEAGRAGSAAARQKLAETERLLHALAQITGDRQLGDWMRNPNPAFEGQTPMQVIERGESDRLWQMIHQIRDAVAS